MAPSNYPSATQLPPVQIQRDEPRHLTERARKVLWRNRPRRPQRSAGIESEYIDSKGAIYYRFTNGVVVKDVKAPQD